MPPDGLGLSFVLPEASEEPEVSELPEVTEGGD